jgi:hypothetical protein
VRQARTKRMPRSRATARLASQRRRGVSAKVKLWRSRYRPAGMCLLRRRKRATRMASGGKAATMATAGAEGAVPVARMPAEGAPAEEEEEEEAASASSSRPAATR